MLLAKTTMATSSITPTTSTGQSAPAKTASKCGLRRSGNLLTATKVPIVVTTHPHKYTFNKILITPLLTAARHPACPRRLRIGRHLHETSLKRDWFVYRP